MDEMDEKQFVIGHLEAVFAQPASPQQAASQLVARNICGECGCPHLQLRYGLPLISARSGTRMRIVCAQCAQTRPWNSVWNGDMQVWHSDVQSIPGDIGLGPWGPDGRKTYELLRPS